MKTLQLHINNRAQASACLLLRSTTATGAQLTKPLERHISSLHQHAEHKTAFALPTSRKTSLAPPSSRKSPQRLGNSIPSIRYQKTPSTIRGRSSYSTATTIPKEPIIHSIFETKTGTWQYLVADPSTLSAVIIDPVLDYDPVSQVISTDTADSLLSMVSEEGYKVDRILETHAHADHLTAAFYLQNKIARTQGHRLPISIGKRIRQVQQLFGKKYGVKAEEYEGVFDKLFDDDETFNIGNLTATAIHLPGHTPDHLGYKIGDNVFCGDSIFHADIGTARCDFPGGSANNLFGSGRKLLAMPDHVRIWTGHDYPPSDRDTPMAFMSVRDHRNQNKHLKESITEEDFIHLREERDAKLGEPRLLHQSLQINIRGGRLPKLTELGHSFLHLPLKLKGLDW
ncbi:probable metallo-beta-lactamase domain protein [Phialocephala subalpina]|uniref:Probable metallo-beta-lactamase domain protein n=1 Tax=Phialocephala subalpina TaxID=576137 RepID=A0A1L7XYM3_9HELO|nr:probable metallo-beta-lactamase domain protein [Phialocephala subalpina]